ncbi:hypothetical protein RND81_04G005300 [Saponaria officinalis]
MIENTSGRVDVDANGFSITVRVLGTSNSVVHLHLNPVEFRCSQLSKWRMIEFSNLSQPLAEAEKYECSWIYHRETTNELSLILLSSALPAIQFSAALDRHYGEVVQEFPKIGPAYQTTIPMEDFRFMISVSSEVSVQITGKIATLVGGDQQMGNSWKRNYNMYELNGNEGGMALEVYGAHFTFSDVATILPITDVKSGVELRSHIRKPNCVVVKFVLEYVGWIEYMQDLTKLPSQRQFRASSPESGTEIVGPSLTFQLQISPVLALKFLLEALIEPNVNGDGFGDLEVTIFGVHITVRNNNSVGYVFLSPPHTNFFCSVNMVRRIHLADLAQKLGDINENDTAFISHREGSETLTFEISGNESGECHFTDLYGGGGVPSFPSTLILCEAVIPYIDLVYMLQHSREVSVTFQDEVATLEVGQAGNMLRCEYPVHGADGWSGMEPGTAFYALVPLNPELLEKVHHLIYKIVVCLGQNEPHNIVLYFHLYALGSLQYIYPST